MFPHFNATSLLIIGFLAILFFGQDKLPDLAKSLGSTLKEFKKAMKDDDTINKEEKIDQVVNQSNILPQTVEQEAASNTYL